MLKFFKDNIFIKNKVDVRYKIIEIDNRKFWTIEYQKLTPKFFIFGKPYPASDWKPVKKGDNLVLFENFISAMRYANTHIRRGT
jgi:hypothetical protein